MQFIIDESTGAAVTQALRSAGHDVLSVAESMPQATDSDILVKATPQLPVCPIGLWPLVPTLRDTKGYRSSAVIGPSSREGLD